MPMFAYAAKPFYESNIRSLAIASSGENPMVNMRAPVRPEYTATNYMHLSTSFRHTLET
jgi:hypothetical protein